MAFLQFLKILDIQKNLVSKPGILTFTKFDLNIYSNNLWESVFPLAGSKVLGPEMQSQNGISNLS